MKVFLDDVRPTPTGWVRAYWPEEVIELLKTGEVTELSLDHDLGDVDPTGGFDVRTGYDVLVWLEEQVAMEGFRPPAYIYIHSANSPARERMESAIQQIQKYAEENK